MHLAVAKKYIEKHNNLNYKEFIKGTAIKIVLSFGGDTDTNAAIVGAMAEALYGVNEKNIELAKEKIPKEFSLILDKGYSK